MAAIASSPAARSARLGLRATPEQEAVLRRAAEVAHKSSATTNVLAEPLPWACRAWRNSQSFSAGLPQSKPSSR